MRICKTWTTQLKNNLSGVMPPTTDPFDKSVFYVSDGLFTPYGAIRFRKMSLETGEELSNTLVRNVIRCIHTTIDYIYAFSDRKIWKLHRSDFSVACVYTEKILRYTDYTGYIDANTFLLMNHCADNLQIFDLQTTKCKRKTVGGGCGLFPVDTDTFLIFNYVAILKYSFALNTLQTLVETERYTTCAQGASGLAYLLCLAPATRPTMDGREVPYSSRILICSPLAEQSEHKCEEIIPGKLFHSFCLSDDERLLYLYQGNSLWVYSFSGQKIIFEYTFEDSFVFKIFARENRLLTYTSDHKRKHILSCWEIGD